MSVSSAQLRSLIVDALYPVSAYKLPDICVSVGLPSGTGEEAFQSKRTYIEKRLRPLPYARLFEVARAVQTEKPSYVLTEALAKIEEEGKRKVSELTRRNIVDLLDGLDLSGRIERFEFFSSVWPDREIPSPSAEWAADYEHSVGEPYSGPSRNMYWDDWTNSELLHRLGVIECSQRRFFALLEAVVHPRTRGEAEQLAIVEDLNGQLRHDGFALLPTARISNRPAYGVREVTPAHAQPADDDISADLADLDEGSVQAMWKKALDRRDNDPGGAITAASTLLESVCKNIVKKSGGVWSESDKAPKLYRMASEKLRLAPHQQTEEAFREILGNCQAVVQRVAEIRNKLGDAHGRDHEHVPPSPRHVMLAVNLAGAMAAFLAATWRDQQESQG